MTELRNVLAPFLWLSELRVSPGAAGRHGSAATQFPGNRDERAIPATGKSIARHHAGSRLIGIRAYAAEQGQGYAVMIFNLNEANSLTASVQVQHAVPTSYSASMVAYDKSIYDQSQSGLWAAPTTTSLGTVSLPFNVNLTPWSMNVLILQ